MKKSIRLHFQVNGNLFCIIPNLRTKFSFFSTTAKRDEKSFSDIEMGRVYLKELARIMVGVIKIA